jgi:hypothetical protein
MRAITWGFLLIVTLGLVINLEARDARKRPKSAAKQADSKAVESEPEDRIDKAHRECVDRDWTTAGMLRCAQVELLQRQHELEEVQSEFVKMLEKRFDPDTLKAFHKARSRWEKYRDEEFKFIDEMFRQIDGTMFLPIRITEKSEIVHRRSKQLRATMDLMDNASLRREPYTSRGQE